MLTVEEIAVRNFIAKCAVAFSHMDCNAVAPRICNDQIQIVVLIQVCIGEGKGFTAHPKIRQLGKAPGSDPF